MAIFMKNLRSDKAICKNYETFTTKQKQYYGILGLQEYLDYPEMHPLVRYTNTTKYPEDILALQRSTVAGGTEYPKNYQVKFHMCYVPSLWQHYVNDGHIFWLTGLL